jgi:hypothetical protein
MPSGKGCHQRQHDVHGQRRIGSGRAPVFNGQKKADGNGQGDDAEEYIESGKRFFGAFDP